MLLSREAKEDHRPRVPASTNPKYEEHILSSRAKTSDYLQALPDTGLVITAIAFDPFPVKLSVASVLRKSRIGRGFFLMVFISCTGLGNSV